MQEPNPCHRSEPTTFTLDEVRLGIEGLSQNKAPGPDGIPPDLFCYNIEVWAPLLVRVLNAAAATVMPTSWSTATIVPIFKKGDRDSPHCYCPISLIDVTVKVLGRVLLNRLSDWADSNRIISEVQYGFRVGKSTADQCLNLYFVIAKYTIAKPGALFLGLLISPRPSTA